MDSQSPVKHQEVDDGCDEWYFESDALALQDNIDYKNLIKSLVLLQSQRVATIQDLEKLLKAKQEALSNPLDFVRRLERGEAFGFPSAREVTEIPLLDWSKYNSEGKDISVPFSDICAIGSPSFGRDDLEQYGAYSRQMASSVSMLSIDPLLDTSTAECASTSRTPAHQFLIRGRLLKEGKAESFNRLWTAAEQQRLEELLVEFPPEEVEARRWKKIADALGNRTTVQVQSRVQKYFVKLAKAGLPIPGRPCSTALLKQKRTKTNHRHQKFNRFLQPSSTFLASHAPPVFMSEHDDDNHRMATEDSTGRRQHPKQAAEHSELLLLQKLRRERLSQDATRKVEPAVELFRQSLANICDETGSGHYVRMMKSNSEGLDCSTPSWGMSPPATLTEDAFGSYLDPMCDPLL